MAADLPEARPDRPQPDQAWAALGVAAVAALAIAALVAGGDTPPLPGALAAGLALAVGGLLTLWQYRARRAVSPRLASGVRTAAPMVLPFAAMLEGFEDPVLVVSGEEPEDLAGQRLMFANAAARALFRTSRDAAPLVTAVRDPKVLEVVDEALFGGITGQTLYEAGGVQDRVWRVTARPLGREPDGRRLAVLSLRDETELRRSERTRADFLANASHELRTPLASLTGFIETLRGHARDDPDARDRFLAIMQDQAARMARLIEDLMSLSRIELNEHVPPHGRVDVRLTVQDVLDAMGPLAEEKRLRFDVRLPDASCVAGPADRDQVVQVLQNLIENAIKYAPREGAVLIELAAGVTAEAAAAPRCPGAAASLSLLTPDNALDRLYVAVRVADGGPGMAREHLPRLTERFYRVEGQKPGERSGTGLGLAIVKHIMNRHRGGMVVESAPGEGAAFTVYFPIPG